MAINSVVDNSAAQAASSVAPKATAGGGVAKSMEASMSMLLMKMMESNKMMRNLAQQLGQQQRQNSINMLSASQDKKIKAAEDTKKAGLIMGGFAIAGGVLGASPIASKMVKGGFNHIMPKGNPGILSGAAADRMIAKVKKIKIGEVNPALTTADKASSTALNDVAKLHEVKKQMISKLEAAKKAQMLTPADITELDELAKPLHNQVLDNKGLFRNNAGMNRTRIDSFQDKIASFAPKDRNASAMNMGKGHYLATGGGPLLNAAGQLVSADTTLEADMGRTKGELIKSNQDVYDRDRLQTEERSREFSRQSLGAMKSLTDLYAGLTAAFTLK